jgi:hypothetical protein
MIGLLFLVLSPLAQASEVPSQPAVQPLKIDILVKQPQPECMATNSDEIVVCAEQFDNESQRLRPITNAQVYDKDESKAEFNIAKNVQMAAEVDNRGLGAGVVSKAIMVRVKIKF